MKLKYLQSFSIFESTSAGSHDRGASVVSPFKYAVNFDHRIGYSKTDFMEDLKDLYVKSSPSERREMMDVIFKNAGVFKISDLSDLSQEKIDSLMKKMEDYLDNKSEYKLQILPDGFILCFESLKKNDRNCDLYYSPSLQKIKICFTDVYPEDEEIIYDFIDFSPESLNIDPEDYNSVIKKCDNS